MVDRAARNQLIVAMEDFLADRTSAFEFDNAIFRIFDETEDATVRELACELWYYYDDLKDHPAALNRTAWDYFQRLLLLLQSSASLETERIREWSACQSIALAAIIIFGIGAIFVGPMWQLFLLTVPLGVISIAIARWRRQESLPRSNYERLAPFSSVSEMLAVHRTVRSFRKARYPATMELRRIRGPIATRVMMLYALMLWLAFSPIALLIQALPEPRARMRVVPV